MKNKGVIMNFEALYSKLPDFIKYNPSILDFFLKIPKKLANINKKSKVIESQNQVIDLLFSNYDLKSKGTLKDIQLLYLELLKFIDNVCRKYDIDYWIADGTLLGAVRHGGFIPWDDDIDLALLREDYNKLIEVLPKEISKCDYLKENCGLSLLRENHKNYFKDLNSVYDFEDEKGFLDEEKFLFLQIAWLKPYVKIDFFPKDFVREDKLDYFKKNYVSTKYKFNQDIKYGKKSFDDEIKVKNQEVGFTSEKTKYFNDALDTLQLTKIWLFETDEVFPLSTITFEGVEFKCPKNVDHWLTVSYGPNYMQLPEVIETHNIIQFIESQFNSKEEMDAAFKNAINFLKDYNDNFS